MEQTRNRLWKTVLFIAIPLICFAVFALAYRDRLMIADSAAPFIPWLLLVLGIGALLVSLLQLSGRTTLERMTLIAVLYFGSIFLFVFPPNSVPDEPTHFTGAYEVSNAAFGIKIDNPEKIKVRLADIRLYYVYHYPYPDKDSYIRMFNGLTGDAPSQSMLQLTEGDRFSGVLYPYVYFPQALGFLIARAMALSPEWLFLLGRIFNLILYAVAVWASIKITPIGKGVLAVVALFPLSIHIAASLSYDVLSFSLAFLAVAQYLRLAKSDKPARLYELLLLLATVCLLAPPKAIFFPFFLLVFFLPKHCFSSLRNSVLFRAGVVVVFFAVFAVFFYSYLHRGDGGAPVITYGDGPFYSLSDITDTPRFFLAMVYHTLQMFFLFYLGSMIGSDLGWLEVGMPKIIWIVFLAISILAAFRAPAREERLPDGAPESALTRGPVYRQTLSRYDRIMFILMFIIAAAASLAIMFISWTPVGSYYILGIQGRYFTPVFPALLLGVLWFRLPARKWITDKRLVLACCILLIPVLLQSFVHIATRGLT